MEQHTATADPKSKPASFDADHAIARTSVLEQLVHIQSLTSTFAEYFSKCDANEFEGASAIFHELDPVEKGLDRWLSSLRSGEMNERACSESLHGYPSLSQNYADSRSLAMLAHLVEIFIKDPLRVVPFTLRGLVSSIDICMDSFSALFNVLRVQMPHNIDSEDGLIYDVLRKSEGLGLAVQTAKALAGKLGRSIDEMKSRGLTIEIRHVTALEGCYQEVKNLAEFYRLVFPLYSGTDSGYFGAFESVALFCGY
jgi:dynactin 1